MTFRSDFRTGVADILSFVPAAATIGVVTGVAAASVGLPPLQTLGVSALVYSPSVMLATFKLLDAGTPALLVIGAALVVGVRFSMLSLALAPHFERLSTSWKCALAYFLWTPTYALAVERSESDVETDIRAYYLGTATPLWVTVHAAMLVGVTFGARVPAAWHLSFVVPLAFIGLLMRFLRDRITVSAALAAGVLSVGAAGLPLNLGVVVATLGGTTVGLALDGLGVR